MTLKSGSRMFVGTVVAELIGPGAAAVRGRVEGFEALEGQNAETGMLEADLRGSGWSSGDTGCRCASLRCFLVKGKGAVAVSWKARDVRTGLNLERW